MELIIAILFFSMASTVCIQLFAKSHLLSKETVNLNHAVIWSQNLAESYLATEGDMETLSSLFETAVYERETATITLFFDKDWNATSQDSADYAAKLVAYPEDDNRLISADIEVFEIAGEASSIYSLNISHHVAERKGNLE